VGDSVNTFGFKEYGALNFTESLRTTLQRELVGLGELWVV